MVQMLILADDLTGAADCGAACVAHGLHTLVVLGDSASEVDADALSIDGDTRRLAPIEAALETARLLKKYLHHENMLLYKKLDSTLRGNFGEELAATLAARRTLARTDERIVVVLAPAFPAVGRTTLGGRQLIHGKPLEKSLQLRDDPSPARSDIAATLRSSRLRPELLALDLIRGDAASLTSAMLTIAQHADVLVCDAETEDDLRKIAEVSMVLGRGTVWAGSAGLASHLPPAAGLSRASVTRSALPSAVGPALFIVGSGSAVSRTQVEVLASRSNTIVMMISPKVLIGGEHSQQSRKYALEIQQVLNAGKDVAVLLDPEVQLDTSFGPLLSASLAAMAKPLANKVGALVVTGGETARSVFQAWGITGLQLVGEVESGLPYSITSDWSGKLPVLTKAGSFGGPESLLRCLEFLHALGHGKSSRPIMREETQHKGPK
jgi:4-hydroxythreonine-4-phosphate dehydrogenase